MSNVPVPIKMAQVQYSLANVAFLLRQGNPQAQPVFDSLVQASEGGIKSGLVTVVAPEGVNQWYADVVSGDARFVGIVPPPVQS